MLIARCWTVRPMISLVALATTAIPLRASEPAELAVRIATPMAPPHLGPARAQAVAGTA